MSIRTNTIHFPFSKDCWVVQCSFDWIELWCWRDSDSAKSLTQQKSFWRAGALWEQHWWRSQQLPFCGNSSLEPPQWPIVVSYLPDISPVLQAAEGLQCAASSVSFPHTPQQCIACVILIIQHHGVTVYLFLGAIFQIAAVSSPKFFPACRSPRYKYDPWRHPQLQLPSAR